MNYALVLLIRLAYSLDIYIQNIQLYSTSLKLTERRIFSLFLYLLSLSRRETVPVWLPRLWPEFFSVRPAKKAPEEAHRFDTILFFLRLFHFCLQFSPFQTFLPCLVSYICCWHDCSVFDHKCVVHSCGALTLAEFKKLKPGHLWNGFSAKLYSTLFFYLPLCVCVCAWTRVLCVCAGVHAYSTCV